MIERYTTKEFKNAFSLEERYQTYLDIELAVLDAYVKLGVIPANDVAAIKKKAHIDVARINEIELETKHDVVAFTRQISETLGPEKKWVHYGLTSTDVVDTSLSLLYKKYDAIIHTHFLELIDAIKEKALTYENTPCIGRTHGMHGEIYSFGLKWATYFDELKRDLEAYEKGCALVETAKISGALGNYANIDPRIQDMVAESLGLHSASIATQVLSRDRHEQYAFSMALTGSTLEKIATEIRNLSRSEIGEVEEGFSKGQKGSSSMPQKRNPISSENITGGVRMLRGYLLPILEDNALYHERDISHSSVERVALLDMIELFDYLLVRMKNVVKNLMVYPENMLRNINLSSGAIFSQRVLSSLIEKGLSREEAYDSIQDYAMEAAIHHQDFKSSLAADAKISQYLTPKELDEIFDLSYYLKQVDFIYKRIGLK